MKCPVCRSDDHGVLRTIASDEDIKRSRRCFRCGHTWATVEVDRDSRHPKDEPIRQALIMLGWTPPKTK